jgi:hypothetical protein
VRDLSELKQQFTVAPEFARSPLYTALARHVAEDDSLLRLVVRCRGGQYPTFLFFAAIHYLLLGGIKSDLAAFYPSVVGETARAPEDAGPAFVSFCRDHEDEIGALLETRLVQTNAVQRSLALRLGLVAIGRRVVAPVHLIEVGASAGIHLRFDRFGYRLGGHRFGDAESPVQIEAEWVGKQPVPDLDAVPRLATTTGIDLHPLAATNPDDRRWLEALVWPDNQREADLLQNALRILAADPPLIRAGNVVELCPTMAAELPPDEPRVVFQVATKMHVPAGQENAFDAAIETLGQNAPLYWLTLERSLTHDPRPQPARPGSPIYLRDPDGTHTLLAIAGGRLDWIDLVTLG